MEDVYKRCVDPSCFDRDPSIKLNRQYPPDRGELGNAGWLFLHTLASKYPKTPDEDSKLKTLAFLYSFADMYPCSVCRDSLVDIYKRFPPRADSRESLVKWTSDIHNCVNQEIGKEPERYSYQQLLEMYPPD
ncbi:Erv1 / Alr family protein [Theileria parva strain Muguga]|uniref:Erv1 / Alr family protein n=1 Tax=Theileria parva strain Muguga TaxID=333668 RepID=UPI001C61E0FD|nr:Erv1 / Alr family protein [Theileria parva strain Muguga]EAN32488.2 Erv1 / Alr family protein [Theileria parva strain Muguga]